MKSNKTGILLLTIVVGLLLSACSTAQVEPTATLAPTDTASHPTATSTPETAATVTTASTPTATEVFIPLKDIGSINLFSGKFSQFLMIQSHPDHLEDNRLPEYPAYDLSESDEVNYQIGKQFWIDTYNANISLDDFCLYIRKNLGAGVGWDWGPLVTWATSSTSTPFDPYDPEVRNWIYQHLGEDLEPYTCAIFNQHDPNFMPFVEFGATETYTPRPTPEPSPPLCRIGQTLTSPVDESLPGHIDILKVTSELHSSNLKATFYLRDIPEEVTVNQDKSSFSYPDLEWSVYIDVDSNILTGQYLGAEAQMFASHWYRGEEEKTGSIEALVETSVLWDPNPDNWRESFTVPAELMVDYDKNTITLIGSVKNVTPESTIYFKALKSDSNALLDPNVLGSFSKDEPLCISPVEFNACEIGVEIMDQNNNEDYQFLAPFADILSVSSTLESETLSVTLQLRDIPESLTVTQEERTNIPFSIAIYDDKPRTNEILYESQYEILVTYTGSPFGSLSGSLEEILKASITKKISSSPFGNNSYLSPIADVEIDVDYEADTITLTGVVPGITPDYKLTFQSFFSNADKLMVDELDCK